MFSVTVFRFSFISSWRMLLLTICCVVLFTRLGIWQTHRAVEKEILLAKFVAASEDPPILFSNGINVRQYQRVRLQSGKPLAVTFLLDNQHHNHEFGYDVLTPIVLTNGDLVLLDRGWIPGDPSRMTLPEVIPLTSIDGIIGHVYYPDRRQWVLGPALERKSRELVIIETLNLDLISQFLHKSTYPFIIRQSNATHEKYLRDWPIISTRPERHKAYALQWFIFAFIAFFLYIALHIKRKT